MMNYAPFDVADYLDDEETIAEYLTAALEDPNPDVFLTAVRDVARARGMTQLAKDAGLGRESLYKALTPGATGQDLLCDANYRVSLAIGLTDTGFVTTAVLCGGYPIDVLSCERDRNSNYITINFPPGTNLDRDDGSLLQNAIHNKETEGWVKFSDPNLTRNGWQADIEIKFRDPDDGEAMVHVEAVVVDDCTLGFWPQFLAAVVR